MSPSKLLEHIKAMGDPAEAYVAGAYLKLRQLEKGPGDASLPSQDPHLDTPLDDEDVSAYAARSLDAHRDPAVVNSLLPSDEAGLREVIETLCEEILLPAKDPLPPSTAKLVLDILEPYSAEGLIGLRCGLSRALFEHAKKHGKARALGVDTSADSHALAQILSRCTGLNVSIELSTPEDIELFQIGDSSAFLIITPDLRNTGAGAQARRISPWDYCYSLANTLGPHSKLVAIVPRSCTNTKFESRAREALVRSHLVETAVHLPERALRSVKDPVLVILSKGNTGSIRMLEASNLGEKARRRSTAGLTDEEALSICGMLFDWKESEAATSADFDRLSENAFSLDPSRYLALRQGVADGQQLGTLASVNRGVTNLSKEALDAPENLPSSFRYLEVRNIADNEIDYNGLARLNPDRAFEYDRKYRAERGDIVISKVGPNFKVAIVADPPEGMTIVVSGNLFIVRAFPAKADPFFLRAFFDSELAWEQLVPSAAGSRRMLALPIGALKSLLVPSLSSGEQAEIAERYSNAREERMELLEQAEKQREVMGSLFGKGSAG